MIHTILFSMNKIQTIAVLVIKPKHVHFPKFFKSKGESLVNDLSIYNNLPNQK